MDIDEVIGYYTYRSFLNRPVGSPNDILFGEGELLLLISDDGIVTGTLAFPSNAGAEIKNFMDLTGSVTSWAPLAFRFVGKGRAGSAIAAFEYEYDGRVAHEWDPAAPPQRRSLIGTVRRNKDHGQAKAGATASFIAVQRDFEEPRNVPGVGLIPEAVTMLSDRVHRLRHTVWHTIRADWHSPKMTDSDREKLRTLGWYLDDPPLRREGTRNILNLTNGAGEDFLYMHRRMIGMVNEVYDKAGKPRPTAWTQIPPANAPQFAYKPIPDPANPALTTYQYDPENSGVMVPPPLKNFLDQVGGNPFFRFNKTARGLSALMQNLVTNLRNPRVLSQLTLGAYGNLVEFTVHNWMHMRWATPARNPGTGELALRPGYDIDIKWDPPANDALSDFHSSHVNPIFWKLHGWVDDCITAWESAHNETLPGQVTRKEVRGISWFAKGTWVVKDDPFDWPGAGSAHSHGGHHGGHHGNELETLEKVMVILKEVSERPDPAPTALVAASVAASATPRLSGFARSSLLDADE